MKINYFKNNTYLFLSALSLLFPVYSETLITADNPQINYYGRFAFTVPSVAKFNWSGSMIEANFSGTSIGINLSDGQNDYDVEIDSKTYPTLKTVTGTSNYSIAQNLSNGSHTIRIVQRSESHYSAAVFGGVYLDNNGQLLSAPQKPNRKIEFVGDSWTVGYGNESTSRTCSDLRANTNTNRSFPKLITNAFHAQSVILGWSGLGIVRNYGDTAKKDTAPFPKYYNSTLGFIYQEWDFSKWTPDLVVICLGINDFSTTPNPDDTMYYNGYHNFISTILSHYPNASIMCVAAHTGPMDAYVKQVVQNEKTKFGRLKIYYAETPSSLSLNGCDWHPTVSDDSLIAKTLTNSIISVLDWDTTGSTKIQNRIAQANNNILNMKMDNKRIYFTVSSLVEPAEMKIVNLSGNLIKRDWISSKDGFVWDISDVPAGIYMVTCGNLNIARKVVIKR